MEPQLLKNRFSFYVAFTTSVVTFITFVIAFLTPPLSGPFCEVGCFEYPFTGIASRFPRDYIWMYPAIGVSLLYLVLMVCIHHYARAERKIFSHIGLSISLIASTILIVDYFVQVSVIQPSLLHGETDGIAILSQYNPHGLFIALEEIGFLLMSLSFVCVAPVFPPADRVQRGLRFTLSFGFPAAIHFYCFLPWLQFLRQTYSRSCRKDICQATLQIHNRNSDNRKLFLIWPRSFTFVTILADPPVVEKDSPFKIVAIFKR